jgi:WD40 repeat protein/tRNA A-37 threonylcarbamoyl transferase component Bud32
MPRHDTDRNLLYGILAVQLNFIDRDALVAAMHAWVLDKDRQIGRILVDQKAIGPERHALLDALVEEHLKAHDGDPEKSLASLAPGQSTRDRLGAIADPELQASLAPLANVSYIPTAAPNPDDFKGEKRRFKQLRPHAKGGLGIVYVAHDSELTREVALKEIQERHADDLGSRARFVREAEITGALEHPGIVPVYGLGTYGDGRPYYAMRFIRGDSLKDVIADFHKADSLPDRDPGERTIALRKLLGRFIDVCDAMDYAHNRGVLHRDLKPGNIMVGKYGETLVVDWGLAKTVGTDEPTDHTDEPRISSSSGSSETLPGSTIGTPQYMSPEQAAGRLDLLGPASDVYSLGATLYSLLTGKPPIESDDVAEILKRAQNGEIPAPRSIKPHIPRPLEAICLKAMSLTPANRYPTPRAIAADLEHWLADEPVMALPETRGQRLARWGRRHRAWVQSGFAAMMLISILAISAVAIVDYFRRSEATQKQAAIDSDGRTKDALRLVEEQKREVEAQKYEVESQIAHIHVNKGLELCERGESAQGLVWLARGLECCPVANGDLAHRIRMHIGVWHHEPHRLRAILSHQAPIESASFSPDGRRVITAGADNKSRIWDAATGRQIGPTLDHRGWVRSASFSPDGKRAVTASQDKTARIWDAATGQQVGPALEHQGEIFTASFSPDGKTVVTASQDKTARIWDAATGQPVGPALNHRGEVRTALFSPDGKYVVTSTTNSAQIWDVMTGRQVGPALDNRDQLVTASFSPDGRFVITAGYYKSAQIWDAATGRQVGPTLDHRDRIVSASFSPDGRFVVTAGWDNSARIWDAATGRQVGPSLDHRGWVLSASFSPDGKRVVTTSWDKTARIWDVATGRQVGPALDHQGAVFTASFSPDGKTVVTAGNDNTARIWDAATSRPVVPTLAHQDVIISALFSPDGRRVVTASMDNTAQIWVAATGRQVGLALTHPEPVFAASFSPDSSLVVTASRDKTARVWDAATGRQLGPVLHHRAEVRMASFSPNGRFVVTASQDTTARIWDSVTGRQVGPSLDHRGHVHTASFSPDGKRVVTASNDNTARIWDAASGRQVGPALEHRGWVSMAAFDPEGRYVVTASWDNTARVWDATTGRQVGPALDHRDQVHTAIFSPDGKTVASASLDKTVRLWPVTPMPGELNAITAWCRYHSGLTIDETAYSRALNAEEWNALRPIIDADLELSRLEE